MEKDLELFVSGRLCLFGEHSDWAGKHRNTNNEIVEGHAIVTGIEQGIYAKIKSDKRFIVIDETTNSTFEIDMDLKKLQEEAKSGSYYSYMCGVAAYVKENYNVGGLEITITKVTLPIKKGLSSSAACCVLVARAFNKVYNLQLNTLGEMQIAYFGENKTPSRCGRLDQACAFGVKPVCLTFDGDDITVEKLQVNEDFHWVFADLMSKKDTRKILSELNSCYPFPQDSVSENVQKYLGEINKSINERAIEYFKNGNVEAMGKLMTEAQDGFDKYVSPACKDELTAPKLHSVLNDEKVKQLSYGGKGVGSQGDGTVQFLAKDKETQILLAKYLKETLKMDSYTLTIKKCEEIKKAIIPIAGMGSRMYPITKVIRKDFLPVYDNGMIKPAIMILLEELYDAGIEEIYLVIDKEDKDMCDKMFNGDLSSDLLSKLSPAMLEYESKIHKIGKKVKYIYQEEKLGLGHAVYLCNKYIKDEPFLLLLGDQIYKSNIEKSCVEQVLENYKTTGKMTISACEVLLDKVSNYGIMSGNKIKNSNSFEITSFVEKPTMEYAEQFLGTQDQMGETKYYSVFGIYVLTSKIFDILEKMVENYNKNFGEIQITNAIDKVRESDGAVAFIPDGEMFDIGTPKTYKYTWKNYNK